jgi:hypothetical protein
MRYLFFRRQSNRSPKPTDHLLQFPQECVDSDALLVLLVAWLPEEETQYFSVVAMQMWSVTTKSEGLRILHQKILRRKMATKNERIPVLFVVK